MLPVALARRQTNSPGRSSSASSPADRPDRCGWAWRTNSSRELVNRRSARSPGGWWSSTGPRRS